MTADLAPITVDDAERLSQRIGLRLESMADSWSGALPLIREAIEREAFRVLGYRSHGDFIADRFGNALSKLGMDLRREVTRELSDAGLSTRAIAAATGVSVGTVHNDRKAQVFNPEHLRHVMPDASPEPTEPVSADADSIQVDQATGEVIEAPRVEEHTVTEKTKVTVGIDGKEYRRPEPKPRSNVLEGDALADYDARQNARAVSDALQTLDLLTSRAHRDRVVNVWWPRAARNEEVPPWGRDLYQPEPIRQIAQALNSLANELENQ